MSSENTINGITWIDLTSPSKDEINQVLAKYDLKVPSETILDFGMLPQLQVDSQTYYCVMRFPRLYVDKTREHRTSFEVDFIIKENIVISIHDIPLFEIKNVHERAQRNHSHLNTPTSSLSLFGILLTEFYSTIRKQLQEITDQLEVLELDMFKKYEYRLTATIAKIAKHLIDIERSLHSSEPVIGRIYHLNKEVGSKNITLAVELFYELQSLLNTNRIILDELRLTHQSMTANHTTGAIRNLSIITFLTLPLGVLVDVLSVSSNPLINSHSQFVLYGIGVITILLILYFRHRKWL